MRAPILRFSLPLLALLLSAFPLPGSAQEFYRPGFTYTLKGRDAGLGIRDALAIRSFVILQVGSSHISALNAETALERWRFPSKGKAIRAMHDRGDTILVEAEQLHSLKPASGEENWQVPLNCYSDTSCNARVRVLGDELIVLSGFDGKDNNLMLLDAATGVRQWPNWVGVPEAKHVALTPSTIVVAGGAEPYAVIGLDRYTGRERWRFRPQGTNAAASGLAAHGEVVSTWWTSERADAVYSVNLDAGAQLSEWIVARRDHADELRGGGLGFFFAYQPSVLGGGGRARAWNNKSGEPLWSKSIAATRPPDLGVDRIYAWLDKGRQALVAIDGVTGEEAWRYERPGVASAERRFQSQHLLLRMPAWVGALDLRTGKVVGIGPIQDEKLQSGPMRYSDRFILLMNGPTLTRMEPVPATNLVQTFDELVETGDVEGAERMHAQLRPFVDDLPGAAEVHQRVKGRKYQAVSARLKDGGLPALLPAILRLSDEKEMLFYEDFKAFILNVRDLMAPLDLSARLRGSDVERTSEVTGRISDLTRRFERKLNAGDQKAIDAVQDVLVRLTEVLLRSGRSEQALNTLSELWENAWKDRETRLAPLLKQALVARVKDLLPTLERAVADTDGPAMSAALRQILALPSIEVLVPGAPDVDSVADFVVFDYRKELVRLRDAVK